MIATDVDALTALIDLGVVDDRDHLVSLLQLRRAEQIEALGHRAPRGLPKNLVKALKDSRLGEIALCEEALTGLGEPWTVED